MLVDGAELFTLEVGEGPEVAILLHGGPGASHDYLRPGLDALADPGRRRLLYYDQRGSGLSPLPAGEAPAGWQRHVADLEALRIKLALPSLTLVGYSWGALLGMLYAVAHPDRVRKLALISPAPAAGRERRLFAERFAEMGRRPSVTALRQRLDLHNRRHRFALAVAGYFADPERALELTPFVVRQSAEDAVWRSLGDDYDVRPQLRALNLSAFVAHGDQDPIPIATAQATADALGVPLLTLKHCGHSSYVEAPDQLFPSLREFLD